MSLITTTVTNGSLNINFDYLDGDEIFGYTVVGNYTIDISDISFTDQQGVLFEGRDAISSAYKQKNITARIGGDEYVNGRIKSLSFDESALVGSQTANVEIEESKRLDDYSNHTFAKYIPNPHLLESFEESFDFSCNGSEYSYNRNISIKYKQSTESSDEFLHNLKVFVSNYYHTVRPNYGLQQDGISENATIDKGFNGIISETIDVIGLSYSIQENFASSRIHENENVSKKFTQVEKLDESGYLGKTVTVDITSLRRDNQNVLRSAVTSTIDSILSEEQSVYGSPVSIERGFNRNSKTANLVINFSTAPKYYRDASVTYNCQKRKEGSFNSFSMTVDYCAVGVNNRDRLNACKNFWSSDSANAVVRASALFPESGTLYEKSRSTSFDYGAGKISETITLTDDDSYKSDLPDGILKYKTTINRQDGVKRFTRVNDIESLKEKLTISDNKTLTNASITAEAVSLPQYGLFHGKNFLNSKTSELNSLLQASEFYIVSDQTSIDLANGTANRVISYVIPTA
jgi:hypothetical protein